MIRLGVDTGGTFTDLARLDAGELTVHKVHSTPDNPARAILSGIGELMGGDPVSEVIHGSTVATNPRLNFMETARLLVGICVDSTPSRSRLDLQ